MQNKIKIVLNREASEDEILEMENIVRPCGLEDCSIEASGSTMELGATMPRELRILIQLSPIIVGTGFLEAIGAHLWEKLKKLIVKSFKHYRHPGEWYLYNPDIYIEIRDKNDLKFQVFFKTNEFKKGELEKSLNKLDKVLKNYKFNEFSALHFSKMKYLPIKKWKISKKKFKTGKEFLEESSGIKEKNGE